MLYLIISIGIFLLGKKSNWIVTIHPMNPCTIEPIYADQYKRDLESQDPVYRHKLLYGDFEIKDKP